MLEATIGLLVPHAVSASSQIFWGEVVKIALNCELPDWVPYNLMFEDGVEASEVA